MRKFLKVVFWSALTVEGVLFLIFGLPMLGALSAFELADKLGCTLNAADAHVCMYMGMDIGERLYSYTIPLIGSLLTPVAFVFSFFDILIVINVICLGCWLGRRSMSKKDEGFAA